MHRVVDALERGHLHEARGVADEEPPGTGHVRHAMADRGGATDRREAGGLAQAPGDGRDARDGAVEARRGRPAPVRQWQGHADVELAAGRGRQPDVIAVADVHLPVIGERGDARVVRDEAEATRKADPPLDPEEAGDAGASAVGADDPGRAKRFVASVGEVAEPDAGHTPVVQGHVDHRHAFAQLGP